MKQTVYHTDDAPAALGPYVQARKAGPYVFLSGQVPINPASGKVEAEDVTGQTKQVMINIDAVLKAAGLTREDVVKATIFITDMNNFGAVNEVYGSFFGEHKPARSCVEVSRLPKDVLVEIETIAFAGA